MTATARTAAQELAERYGLGVVVIPPNRPSIRVDHPDVVFTHKAAKQQALLNEIRSVHASRRPVLVGTASVEESDHVAGGLRRSGIECEVLNARTDELEARIIARAGSLDAVTISTNMAGRGTDIRLGGENEEDRDAVVALGGLYVIGTNRHESLRIDQQLRGRAGRQGDPGSSRFFISLEDDLIERYGIRHLIPPKLLPERQDEPLDNPIIRREIARAQRIIEGQNSEIRRTLWDYSSLIEEQRRVLHGWRQEILCGRAPFSLLERRSSERWGALSAVVGDDVLKGVERAITLFHIDRCWSDHLARVADLREGIHLRRVAGRDPLEEFGRLAAGSCHEMRAETEEAVIETFESAEIDAEGIDLEREGLRGPASTWTYLVSDDPLRVELSSVLAGNIAFAAGAALTVGPLIIAWGLYNRYLRKRVSSRPPP
jgi:preprotein translocase subunit SecA